MGLCLNVRSRSGFSSFAVWSWHFSDCFSPRRLLTVVYLAAWCVALLIGPKRNLFPFILRNTLSRFSAVDLAHLLHLRGGVPSIVTLLILCVQGRHVVSDTVRSGQTCCFWCCAYRADMLFLMLCVQGRHVVSDTVRTGQTCCFWCCAYRADMLFLILCVQGRHVVSNDSSNPNIGRTYHTNLPPSSPKTTNAFCAPICKLRGCWYCCQIAVLLLWLTCTRRIT
jgi:hypothetical protein